MFRKFRFLEKRRGKSRNGIFLIYQSILECPIVTVEEVKNSLFQRKNRNFVVILVSDIKIFGVLNCAENMIFDSVRSKKTKKL